MTWLRSLAFVAWLYLSMVLFSVGLSPALLMGYRQAMWVIRCNRMGPFIVASDLEGNCLFERENERISKNLHKAYEGTKPAILKRFGETDDKSDELIG